MFVEVSQSGDHTQGGGDFIAVHRFPCGNEFFHGVNEVLTHLHHAIEWGWCKWRLELLSLSGTPLEFGVFGG